MKRTLMAVVVMVMLAEMAQGQSKDDDFPTVAQCRAYKSVWKPVDRNQLPYGQLMHRAQTLAKCQMVALSQHRNQTDDDTIEGQAFGTASGLYVDDMMGRLQGFVIRHGLKEQFLKEDAAAIKDGGAPMKH